MEEQLRITRREAVGAAALGGLAFTVVGTREGLPNALRLLAPEDAVAACVLTPAKTEGPYFVDERLNRSDIREGQPGVPLTLDLTILDADADCAPLTGATVDIWHAGAQGLYSDETANGTKGQTWLRGQQTTDAAGKVTFLTVYPGWYSGRAVHIHAKIRTAAGVTFNTQFFFDEALNSTVLATPAYARGGKTRDTTDQTDTIYGSDGAALLLTPQGSVEAGYRAGFTVGVSRKTVDTSTATGLTPPPGAGGPGSAPAPDESIDFALRTAQWKRKTTGGRQLQLSVSSGEAVAVLIAVTRGSKVLTSKRIASLAVGSQTIRLNLPASVPGGTARLQMVVVDARGNAKKYRRTSVVPKKRP